MLLDDDVETSLSKVSAPERVLSSELIYCCSSQNMVSQMGKKKIEDMTKEEMLARISELSDEIDANEQENMLMQDEINDLYKALDKETESS
ncbi:TPA: hypothetical protein RQN23_002961 [Aeromonas veronii]|nr:hypothetical protein [Aeromonas veronii]